MMMIIIFVAVDALMTAPKFNLDAVGGYTSKLTGGG